MAIRERLRNYLDTTDSLGGWICNGVIAALIFLSALIFVVQTYPIDEGLRSTLETIDWLIVVIFTLEYGVRLWAAERPWQYLVSLYGLIDLLSILPFWVGVVDVRDYGGLRRHYSPIGNRAGPYPDDDSDWHCPDSHPDQ